VSSGIAPAEVAAKLADGWTLLDVRTAEEWDQVRLPGSVHLPMQEIVARLDEVPDRVICVCAVGARSDQVATWLSAQGREAVNLDGGIRTWLAEGRPVD
jgi:rhodanese-related sulfurtransferase